jgi:hypothetical protein
MRTGKLVKSDHIEVQELHSAISFAEDHRVNEIEFQVRSGR